VHCIDPAADPAADLPADPDRAAVLAANQAFYAAFEAADLDAMSEAWEHSDRVTCVHPGWAVLRGWGKVVASWAAMFSGDQRLQFILTNVEVAVGDGFAWVTVDENVLDEHRSATVAALNLFARVGPGEWKLVAHHGAVVAGS
jgi:ketosteroid isomerase-like protein